MQQNDCTTRTLTEDEILTS